MLWQEAATLAVVGLMITALVYGAVALIVKMDDIGLHVAAKGRTRPGRAFGRGLVTGMPKLLAVLSFVGTLAMLWVGGNILTHGLQDLGWPWLYDQIHHLAVAAAAMAPQFGAFVEWAVTAALDGVLGVGVGMFLIPIGTRVIAPALEAVGKLRQP